VVGVADIIKRWRLQLWKVLHDLWRSLCTVKLEINNCALLTITLQYIYRKSIYPFLIDYQSEMSMCWLVSSGLCGVFDWSLIVTKWACSWLDTCSATNRASSAWLIWYCYLSAGTGGGLGRQPSVGASPFRFLMKLTSWEAAVCMHTHFPWTPHLGHQCQILLSCLYVWFSWVGGLLNHGIPTLPAEVDSSG
jgi:hypothetical protein